MEVRQLQIFCALAEELNFTRTAERVHTVQSNVTSQIKALEDELGVQLFDRLGKRVSLTDAGQRFHPFARQALAAMEQGQQAVQVGADPSGPLRIAAPESVLTYRLPPLVRAFRQRYPKVELVFRPHTAATVPSELESGRVDLAFHLVDEMPGPALRCHALQQERIFLLTDAAHPLARQRTVKPTDLVGQSFLLTESGCGYRAKFERILAVHKIRLGNVTEFSSVEAIKECVAAGMGIALLPAMTVAREIRQSLCKPLHWAGPSLDITTHLVWHQDKWVSPAMNAFRELVTRSIEDPHQEGPQWILTGTLSRLNSSAGD
ncbi:LysR family transcriptional regulator [Acidobacteria bacterium AB60]|nr:LysR family transcriptional regulator [Acidobacteria bacterium AB60]